MIWVLLGFGLLLIIFNIKTINKEKNSFNYVFKSTEEDMKEFDFKLSEVRREFSETILELQKEIEKLKGTYINDINNFKSNIIEDTKENMEIDDKYSKDNNKENDKNMENAEIFQSIEDLDGKQKKSSGNNVKIDEVNKLLHEGLSIEEVSERLGIGKGEVLLIKELYLR